MNILVVDDEPLARRRLVRMLGLIEETGDVCEAGDAIEALAQVRRRSPDVVLLDIRMPGMDGLTLAREVPELPPVIFTTAYDNHALAAYDAGAIDYLLKPVQLPKLERALRRARERLPSLAPGGPVANTDRVPPGVRLIVREGSVTHLLDARTISRLHAADKYTVVRHEGHDFLMEESLRELETRLVQYGFFRCHRAELVNLSFTRALRGTAGGGLLDLSDGQVARVSRRQLPSLRRALESAPD